MREAQRLREWADGVLEVHSEAVTSVQDHPVTLCAVDDEYWPCDARRGALMAKAATEWAESPLSKQALLAAMADALPAEPEK